MVNLKKLLFSPKEAEMESNKFLVISNFIIFMFSSENFNDAISLY